ncbi:MAG TPA: ACT domain-containing protein [Sphingomicrobium sp.]
MVGERDLSRLLAALDPTLHPERYSFSVAVDPTLHDGQFALVREDERLTAIRPDASGDWARISLGVHSSLEAVGLTAALSSRLAEAGISANIVAGLYHDHLFVPWERRDEALDCLRSA